MSQATALYDLHLHTGWSYDATARMETYFMAARRNGVRCLAITDHHLIDGLDEMHAVARAYPDVRVIPAVKAASGLIVIAHPFNYFQKHDLTRMDALRDVCQLDGIECAHSTVPPKYGARYRVYCEQHGLFSTGGSDCHDESSIDQMFARHGGPAAWLDEFLAVIDGRP